ncbi:hypothetical protein CHS0354_000885, partial [Potamilus streckersoni]
MCAVRCDHIRNKALVDDLLVVAGREYYELMDEHTHSADGYLDLMKVVENTFWKIPWISMRIALWIVDGFDTLKCGGN